MASNTKKWDGAVNGSIGGSALASRMRMLAKRQRRYIPEILDYLERHNMTHRQFGDLVGTCQSNISRFLRYEGAMGKPGVWDRILKTLEDEKAQKVSSDSVSSRGDVDVFSKVVSKSERVLVQTPQGQQPSSPVIRRLSIKDADQFLDWLGQMEDQIHNLKLIINSLSDDHAKTVSVLHDLRTVTENLSLRVDLSPPSLLSRLAGWVRRWRAHALV